MDTATMLLEFSDLCGIPGVDEAADYAKKLLAPYGTVSVSPLGSIVCTVKEPEEGKPHLLLDAHLDEIGLMVTYLEENGFVRVGQFGGIDSRLLASSRVTIHTRTEKINGVICSIPPHLSGGRDMKALPIDKIYIDTGLTTEQAKDQIRPGDRVSFHHAPRKMLNNLVSAKALDDRVGCITLMKALEYLGDDVPCGLTVVFSTMEEIGGMGAKTSAYSVDPTHALAVDVGFGSTPDTPDHKATKVGEGPTIGFSPLLNHKFSRRLVELAEEHKIPYHYEVMGGTTGTNCDSIVTARHGVPTALLSVPIRNMHMPIEVVDTTDVEHAGRLIAHWVKDLGTGGNQ